MIFRNCRTNDLAFFKVEYLGSMASEMEDSRLLNDDEEELVTLSD